VPDVRAAHGERTLKAEKRDKMRRLNAYTYRLYTYVYIYIYICIYIYIIGSDVRAAHGERPFIPKERDEVGSLSKGKRDGIGYIHLHTDYMYIDR